MIRLIHISNNFSVKLHIWIPLLKMAIIFQWQSSPVLKVFSEYDFHHSQMLHTHQTINFPICFFYDLMKWPEYGPLFSHCRRIISPPVLFSVANLLLITLPLKLI